jgi:hypothetical protein
VQQVAQPLPPPPRRSRWKLGLGIPLLVAGRGVAGLGTASLLIDGQCVEAGMMPCDRTFDTKLAGYIEIGAGAAAAAAGLVLIIVDGVEQRRDRAQERRSLDLSLRPVGPRGSAGLSWSLSF